jgi:hypothetical protein
VRPDLRIARPFHVNIEHVLGNEALARQQAFRGYPSREYAYRVCRADHPIGRDQR